jgi:hypothetical protein
MIYKALIIPQSSCSDADIRTFTMNVPIATVLLDVAAAPVTDASASFAALLLESCGGNSLVSVCSGSIDLKLVEEMKNCGCRLLIRILS